MAESKKIDSFVSSIVLLNNDAELFRPYIQELHGALSRTYKHFEIILVDDGSVDATPSLIDETLRQFDCCRYLRLARRYGTEVAITAGFETAIGELIVVAIAGVDPIAEVLRVLEVARESNKVVMGARELSGIGWLERSCRKMFYAFSRRILELELVENTTYLLAINRAVLNSINSIKDKFRYLKGFTALAGHDIYFHKYKQNSAPLEKRRRGLLASFNLAIDIVVSNSVRPLRIANLLALVVSTANFLYIGYIALIALFKNHVAEGWITLSLQNAVSFFVLSIVLAIACEYLGRILLETKDRPFYFVREERSSSVLISEKEKLRNIVDHFADSPSDARPATKDESLSKNEKSK